MPYVKGIIEICIFCEYALSRMIYVDIEENIRVSIKGLDNFGKVPKTYLLNQCFVP